MSLAMTPQTSRFIFFFFNDTATTEIYTLSLHDALPILCGIFQFSSRGEIFSTSPAIQLNPSVVTCSLPRSEEHTSELQSLTNLACRLLLEIKKTAAGPCADAAARPGLLMYV